jgi:hypothetical protein
MNKKSTNSPSRRRAREELTERVEGLAQQILDHLADNPQTFPPVTSERGRSRGSGRSNRARRSVSFSNICGCTGTQCTSGPGARHPPPAYSDLDPRAEVFTPARGSRNTARRSRPQTASSAAICRPRLVNNHSARSGFQQTQVLEFDTGLATALLSPQHFASSEEVPEPEREKTPTPASPPPPASPSPPPPRGPSPVEPDTSHIGAAERRSINLAFRCNINGRFDHEASGVEKSYDYSCSCLNRKSQCECSEAVLEISLKVKYQLSDPLRHNPSLGGVES